jgi:hypothetical protein
MRDESANVIRTHTTKFLDWLYRSWLGWNCSSIPTMIAKGNNKVWQIPEALCTVRAPDDGWRFHLKHVERYWKFNKLRKVTFVWFCLRNLSEDARTYECQNFLTDYDILISVCMSVACSITYNITYRVTILRRTPDSFIHCYVLHLVLMFQARSLHL